MKPVRLVVIAAALAAGCVHPVAISASHTRDRGTLAYVTFFVLDRDAPDASDRQLKSEIVAALNERGLVETSPEEAEAVVVVNTATAARHSRQAMYEGWGGWDWRVQDTRAAKSTETYDVGTSVVDVFDAWTKTLIWHGAGRGSEASGANSEPGQMVRRIFRDFPPIADQAVTRRAAATQRPAPAGAAMQIIFSPQPATLIRIDGEPRYASVDGTELQRITNTTALIVRDASGTHYLRLGRTWLEVYALIGPWSNAGMVPEGADLAVNASAGSTKEKAEATAPAQGPLPVVYVATTPTELLVTDGEPEYAPYPGTSLSYARIGDASLFKEPTDKELYVHLSEGWFRAWTTTGPWQPVAESALPADLRMVIRVRSAPA